MMDVLQWNIRGLQANREELNILLSNFNPVLAPYRKLSLNLVKQLLLKTILSITFQVKNLMELVMAV